MERSIFDTNMIQVLDHIDSLPEGIEVGTKLLFEHGYTDSNYGIALIKNFEEYGNRYIISPYLILPHARPEQGVLRSGISMILLKQPYYYRELKKSIRLIVILAAVDSRTHLEYLKEISKIFSSDLFLKRILSSHTKEQLLAELMDCE